MFYLLSERHRLCGWEKLPFALTDRQTGEVFFLPKPAFLLLYRCDGRHDLVPSALSSEERRWLESFLEKGLIRRCAEGEVAPPSQRYRQYPARYKESAQWSVTGRCNLRCRHCLMSAPEVALGQADTAACLEIIRQLGECGVRRVSLTGGEPLLRSDLLQLLDALAEQEIVLTTLYTNGLLLSDGFLSALGSRGLCPQIQMSYDGPGVHDRLRGVPGAEKAVREAFARCREQGFPTSAAMCLYRDNAEYLAESVELLASLGCGSLKVSGLRALGDAKQIPESILPQEELFDILLRYIPSFLSERPDMDLMLDGLFAWTAGNERCFIPFEHGGGSEDSLLCEHLRRSFYISPEGQVLPCMSMVGTAIEAQFPNMLRTPLQEILNCSEYMDRCDLRLRNYLEYNPECTACDHRASCRGGCRALALGDQGTDYLAKDLWACAYFRDGWREKLHACLESEGILPLRED